MAIARFEFALAAEQRVGARVFAARTRLACARVLLARGAEGDLARSVRLVREALDFAERRQLVAVAREAKALEEAAWNAGHERAPDRPRGVRVQKIVDR